MNIMSYIKEQLKKEGYDMKAMRFPHMFKRASTLVGAGINDATHAQLADAYRNQGKYVKGWIYSEEGYQRIVADFEAEMGNRPASGIFFPEVSNINTLAYDCLPKTINQAMGALIFSRRD
jgi:hypothetical protein